MLAHERQAGGGPGAISDDVAEAPGLVDARIGGSPPGGLERFEVAVDVRDDRDAHGAEPASGRP